MKHSVSEHTLSTGSKGIIVDVPGSSVFNLVIRFNSGFQFGPHDKYELSHFVEHLIGNGNRDYPKPGDFKVEFSKQGAYRNANTSSRYNGYVASGAIDELERILGLMVSYVGRPTFPESTFATELNNVREEINRYNGEPSALCGINLAAAMFPAEYEKFATRIEQLDGITLDEVTDFYTRTHTANNMRFYIAGPLKEHTELIVRFMEELSGELMSGERLLPSAVGANVLPKPVYQHFGVDSIYYCFETVVPEFDRDEMDAGILMRALLFIGDRSRIYSPMRDRGLAYTIGGSIYSDPGRSFLDISGYVTKRTARELFELIVIEIKRLSEELVEQEELDASNTFIHGSILLSHQTPADMLSWYIGMYDSRDEIRDFNDTLERLRRVTPEAIMAVAKKFVETPLLEKSFVGNLSEVEAGEYASAIDKLWLKH